MKTSSNRTLIIDSVKHFFTDKTRSNEDEEKATVKDLLEKLRPIPDAPMRLTVHQSSILTDSISIFTKPLKISFEGEPAIGGGGPKSEFFTILLRELLSPSACTHLFEGRENIFFPSITQMRFIQICSKLLGAWLHHQSYKVDQDFQVFQKQDPNDLTDYIGKEDVIDVDC